MRQEYEDMINITTQLFTKWTNFVNTMAQEYGFKITKGFQELEKQRADLRRELEVLATASRYNDSHIMSCLRAGQTHIYSVIDDSGAYYFLKMRQTNDLRFLMCRAMVFTESIVNYES